MEFGYHGHHDSVMVSINGDLSELGSEQCPNSIPSQKGLPKAVTDLTLIMPFNCDISSLEQRIDSVEGKIACIIMEPILMSTVIVFPKENFLKDIRYYINLTNKEMNLIKKGFVY